MTDNQTTSENTEGDISTEELVNRYNTIVGEFKLYGLKK